MEDNKRSNEQMLEEILQEAQSLREAHKAAEKQEPSLNEGEKAAQPVEETPSAPPTTPSAEEEVHQDSAETESPVQESRWKRLFGRKAKHRAAEEPDETDDIYYGLQLKPIEEYQKGMEDTGEHPITDNHPTDQFSFLFDDSPGEELDEEIANRFRELHDDRRRRVKQALESEGLNFHQVVSEYGVVQPLPKKRGIDHGEEIFSVSPGAEPISPEIPGPPPAPKKQVARKKQTPLQSNAEPVEKNPPRTVEEASEPEVPVEEKKADRKETPSVKPSFGVLKPDDDELTVDAILAQVRQKSLQTVRAESEPVNPSISTSEPELAEEPPVESSAPQEESKTPPESAAEFSVEQEEKEPSQEPVPESTEKQPEPVPTVPETPVLQEEPVSKPVKAPASSPRFSVKTVGKRKPAPAKEPEPTPQDSNPFVDETPRQPKMPREAREGPSYAPHTKPVHLMDMDVLDFALREEAKFYEEQVQKEKEEENRRRKKKYLKMKKKQALEKGFALNGEEPQDDSIDAPEDMEEELDDFNSPSDAPSLSHDLRAGMRELMLRVLVTGLCTGLLGLFGFMGEFNTVFAWELSDEITTAAYMALNVIFLLLSMGFCFRMIGSGLMSLIKFRANSDSALSLASIAALVQAVYACFFPEEIMNGSLHLYSVLASGALFLNSVGKLVMIRRIWNNFRFVSSRESKYAVQLYDDYNTSLKLARDCVLDAPVIAYQQKAGFLSRFLQYSYEPDPLENNSQTLAPIGFIASVALCAATLVISHSASQAISAFTAAACICVPFTGLLGGNLLLKKLSALAKKCGAMVVGYPAVEKFSSVNAVMLDAKDLYPKGTVILGGIKTFGNQRIDEAILEATSLMCAAGGPLVSVFDQIIKTRREILPKVDKPVYEDGRGLTGWVSGHRVLIGNRDLLAAHHIDPPSRDFENKYTSGGKKAAYLAVGGQLVAMFLLTYRSDSHRARELQRLETNGVSLIVRTCDPNITSGFLANAFGLDPHSIRVLPDSLGEEYIRVSQADCPRTPALLATRGRAVSMLRMISACIRTRSNLTLAAVMQSVSVILGFVLVAFLACYSGLQQLSTLSLLLYEVFWSFVILFFPRLHKP